MLPTSQWVFAFLGVLCLLVGANRLSGQVVGRVVDAGDQPVAGARVEIWGARQLLGVENTTAAGEFTFSAAATHGAVGVLVQQTGFSPLHAGVSPPATALVLRLRPGVVALETIEVRAAARRRLCPNREEPEARALWRAAAERYSNAPDTLGIEVKLFSYHADVPRSRLGEVDETRPRPGSRGTGNHPRTVGPKRGYGYRLSESMNEEFAFWSYVALGSHAAQHFVHPSFGTYNQLSVRVRGPDHVVLTFCSCDLEKGAVGVEGTLTLASDTTLLKAEWKFRTHAPQEEAGGEVVFAPYAAGAERPWLVPASSLYWRRREGHVDRYFQRWERYARWQVAPPDSPLHNRGRLQPLSDPLLAAASPRVHGSRAGSAGVGFGIGVWGVADRLHAAAYCLLGGIHLNYPRHAEARTTSSVDHPTRPAYG
jgi:hypothetical protein